MKNDTCPPDPALGTSHNFKFNQSVNGDLWSNYGGPVNFDSDTGAGFTITQSGDSPTLRTNFYFFWGRTEIWLKAAEGSGIVSSMMWLSDDLDEVDWEFLGGNDTHASTNWYGKGVEDYQNGAYHPMSGIQQDYHNYTTVWTKDKLEWYIDGGLVRTLLPSQANDTKAYPQTPMRMSLGIWAGGDPSMPVGTRQWAGDVDYTKGPFTMYIKSAMVSDYSTGKEYTYGDKTGSFESIQIVDEGKNSTAVDNINKPPEAPPKSIAEKWAELSSGAKIGIYCGAGTGAALILVALIFYCIKQRRRGAKEAKIAAEQAEAERLELERFKKEGIDPDSLQNEGTDYRKSVMATNNISASAAGANGLGNDYAKSINTDYARSMNNISRDGSTFNGNEMTMGGPLGSGGGKGWDGSDAAMAAVVAGGRPNLSRNGPMDRHQQQQEPTIPNLSRNATQSSYNGPPISPRSPPPGSSVFNPPQDQRSMRSGTPASMNFHTPMSGPGSPRHGGPPSRSQSPMVRTQSPGMPPQGNLPATPSYPSRVGSPATAPYGMPSPPSRMGSPAMSQQRMNSPGPGRMNSPGPNRMNSPGPNRMNSPGPNRMQSPGPNRMNSPGPGRMMQQGQGSNYPSRGYQTGGGGGGGGYGSAY